MLDNPRASINASLVLTLAFGFVHLLVMGRFGLSSDEAHYALYGYFPDWSYFDHPPLVGWAQALVQLFASTDFALRLWPWVFSLLTAWALYRLANRLFPERGGWVGFWSLVLMYSAVVFHLLALAWVPDTALMLFSLLGVYALIDAIETDRWSAWVQLAICFGMAGLSKYTAVTLVFSALLVIAYTKKWVVFRRPRFWLALALSVILIAPVLYWNATHHWISFLYQLHHGTGDGVWSLQSFAMTQAGQLLAEGPGVYLFGIAALWGQRKHLGHRGVAYSLAFALPILLLFAWNGGYVPGLPHWTVLGWLFLAPLTANWLMSVWASKRWVRWFAYLAGAYAAVLVVLVHLQLAKPWLSFPEGEDPFTEFYGWGAAVSHAGDLNKKMATTGEAAPKIFIGSWTLASRLAWYGRPEPIMVTDGRFDQFDLWYGSPKPGDRGTYIVWSVFPYPPATSGDSAYFDSCKLIDTLPVYLAGSKGADFLFYACEGYHP